MDVRQKRQLDDADPFTKIRAYAQSIIADVGDPDMHPSIPTKVARALVDCNLTITEVAEVTAIIRRKREAGQLDKPGAYFLSSMRRLFRKHDLTW